LSHAPAFRIFNPLLPLGQCLFPGKDVRS
jgi:hypothetical protein